MNGSKAEMLVLVWINPGQQEIEDRREMVRQVANPLSLPWNNARSDFLLNAHGRVLETKSPQLLATVLPLSLL